MKWVICILLMGIMAMGLLFGYIGSSIRATFTDLEPSSDNVLTIATSWGPTTLLNDDFGGEPWDANWDGNGTTTWQRDSVEFHSGLYSAYTNKDYIGLLTTDDLDASWAASISVSFWYRPDGSLDPGDVLVKLYNDTQYNTWYDITNHSSYVGDQWCYFSEVITDSQYFKSNFRLRFDSSQLAGGEDFHLDDVLITKE